MTAQDDEMQRYARLLTDASCLSGMTRLTPADVAWLWTNGIVPPDIPGCVDCKPTSRSGS